MGVGDCDKVTTLMLEGAPRVMTLRIKFVFAVLLASICVLAACRGQEAIPLDAPTTSIPTQTVQPTPATVSASPSVSPPPSPTPLPTYTLPPTATPVHTPTPTPILVPTPTPTPIVLYVPGWDRLRNWGWAESIRPLLASAIKSTSWIEDGISDEVERKAAQNLLDMATWTDMDLPTLVHILESPFLETLTPSDAWTLHELRHYAQNEQDYFARLMELPSIQDGIDDTEAKIIGALWPFDYDRNLRAMIEPAYTIERSIDFPISGPTDLTVLRLGQPPAEMTFNRLEEVIRHMEAVLQQPLPDNNILLILSDKVYNSRGGPPLEGDYSGLKFGGQMVILETFDTTATNILGATGIIAHETAHYYFLRGPHWLVEGFAEGARAVVESSITGKPLDLNDPSLALCPDVSTFRELEDARIRVNDDEDAIVSKLDVWDSANGGGLGHCSGHFGKRAFVQLYLELDSDQFHKGLQELLTKTAVFTNTEDATVEDVISAFGPVAEKIFG